MSQWIKRSIPDDTEKIYWIIMNSGNKSIVYPLPCRYSVEHECWIDFEGLTLFDYSVIAHYPIFMPKHYLTIGSGIGYYIKTARENEENFYGFGCQFANWVMHGYPTEQKAIIAAKRMKKLDDKQGYGRDLYEIVNGEGESVYVVYDNRKNGN